VRSFSQDTAVNAAYQKLSLKAAEAVANQLRAKPGSCFGLPTGRSPLGCYELLSRWSEAGKLDWSQARCFALDDYIGAERSKTFHAYLEEHLYRHTNLPRGNRYHPLIVDNYDRLIADCGGLDLSMVGIGRNGHVAFNEPGTPRASWTHCCWLAESTIQANAANFDDEEAVPRRAVTMGIATLLASKTLIVLASGEHKKEVIRRALSGPRTTELPASFLQEHDALEVLADFDL